MRPDLGAAEPRARGAFGHQCAVGLTSTHWPPRFNEALFMGLPAAGQHVAGGVALADGTRAYVIRHFQNEIAVRFLLYRGTAAGELTYDRSSALTYTGLCEVDTVAGRWGIRQSADRFSFQHDQTGARWHEGDLVDLELQSRLEALQVAVPDAIEPLGYLCRGFDVVGGSVTGVPVVDGFIIHEQVHLGSGRGWAQSQYKQELQGAWVAFATRFDDGALHWGQLCWSPGGWGFAAIQRSDEPAILLDRPLARIDLDGDGWPVRSTYDTGAGGEWEWCPHEPTARSGCIPLPGRVEHVPRWREGVVRQVGEPRAVAFATSWNEVYPTRLLTPG